MELKSKLELVPNIVDSQTTRQILCNIKSDDSSIWYDRAIVLENMNRNIDAIHCYLKTLELAPDFNDAFMRMASVYQKEGKLNELIEVYETAKVNEEDEENDRDVSACS